MWRKRIEQHAPTLAALLAVLPYLDSIGYGFLYEWDDGPFVTANPRIGFSLDNIVTALTSNIQTVYTPLTTLSLMLDHALWGNNPVGYHAVNLLFFGGCALMLHQIMRRLNIPVWSALLLTLLWSWNPAKCESVCWISERKGVASGFFAFAAFYTFLGELRRGGIGWRSALLTVAAILFKPWALPLPGVMLVCALVLKRGRIQRVLHSSLLPLCSGLAAGTLVTVMTFGELSGNHSIALTDAAANLLRYLGDAVFPLALNPLQPRPEAEELPWLLLPGVIIVTAWMALWRRGRVIRSVNTGFAFAYLGMSLPVLASGAFTNAAYADRYNYILSAVFWCWIGAVVLPCARLDIRRRRLAALAAVVMLVGCLIVSIGYQRTFSDSKRLFTRAISGIRLPVVKAMEGLALTGVNRRDSEAVFDASQAFLFALDKRPPDEAAACASTGALLEVLAVTMRYPMQSGDSLAAYLAARPENEMLYSPEIFLPHAFNTAVSVLLSTGKRDQAVKLLDKQLHDESGDEFTLHFASGLAGYLSGDLERARREWLRAGELRPDDDRIRKNLEITGVKLP